MFFYRTCGYFFFKCVPKKYLYTILSFFEMKMRDLFSRKLRKAGCYFSYVSQGTVKTLNILLLGDYWDGSVGQKVQYLQYLNEVTMYLTKFFFLIIVFKAIC